MNEKFKSCLTECKQLNSVGLLRQTGATADKILYNHAIHMVSKKFHIFSITFIALISLSWGWIYVYVIFLMIKNNAISFDMIFEVFNGIIYFQCQSAALDELFGKGGECFQRYHTAQILLHSLAQHVSHSQDRALLIKCTYYFRSVSSLNFFANKSVYFF